MSRRGGGRDLTLIEWIMLIVLVIVLVKAGIWAAIALAVLDLVILHLLNLYHRKYG